MVASVNDTEMIDSISTRSAAVVWRMAHGWRPTTREVAALVGLSMGGAWAMMARMSRGVPIALGSDKRWYDLTLHDLRCVDHDVLR